MPSTMRRKKNRPRKSGAGGKVLHNPCIFLRLSLYYHHWVTPYMFCCHRQLWLWLAGWTKGRDCQKVWGEKHGAAVKWRSEGPWLCGSGLELSLAYAPRQSQPKLTRSLVQRKNVYVPQATKYEVSPVWWQKGSSPPFFFFKCPIY